MAVSASRTLHPHTFLRREPRQARSLDRLERLLVATSDLLAADGYPGVTVAGLKSLTGMPHSTVYDVVADPRDLVAVLAVRALDSMHEALAAFARTVGDAESAIEFVRIAAMTFIDQYRTNAILRAALSGLDGDPAYRWINLADSVRNARVIVGVLQRFTDDDTTMLFQRCLLMAHLTGTAAAMAVDLDGATVPDTDGDAIVGAFEFILAATLDR